MWTWLVIRIRLARKKLFEGELEQYCCRSGNVLRNEGRWRKWRRICQVLSDKINVHVYYIDVILLPVLSSIKVHEAVGSYYQERYTQSQRVDSAENLIHTFYALPRLGIPNFRSYMYWHKKAYCCAWSPGMRHFWNGKHKKNWLSPIAVSQCWDEQHARTGRPLVTAMRLKHSIISLPCHHSLLRISADQSPDNFFDLKLRRKDERRRTARKNCRTHTSL